MILKKSSFSYMKMPTTDVLRRQVICICDSFPFPADFSSVGVLPREKMDLKYWKRMQKGTA